MKKYESLMQCHCLKCGHKWYPRKPEKPMVCPKCHCVKWWEEKKGLSQKVDYNLLNT